MTKFHIQIISDTICPWCYIGYCRFAKARELYAKTYPGGSKDTFSVEWRPYYLDPDAPLEGVLTQEKMVSRMGEDRATSAQKHMTALGRGEGIEIKYGGKTGNTRLSHRLLHYAMLKDPAVQTEVALELFRLHFGEERDMTDIQTMLDAATNSDFNVGEVRAYLESGVGAESVDAEAQAVRDVGVRGVPRFRFVGTEHDVDGAGDTMEFFEILMAIKEKRPAAL